MPFNEYFDVIKNLIFPLFFPKIVNLSVPTDGMMTKSYGSDHSPQAWGLMAANLIGVLIDE